MGKGSDWIRRSVSAARALTVRSRPPTLYGFRRLNRRMASMGRIFDIPPPPFDHTPCASGNSVESFEMACPAFFLSLRVGWMVVTI
jgi:hypothetical protein